MPKGMGYDEDQYEAESQVQRALMETPLAKAEVKRVKAEIKTQKAETKKRISGKDMKKSSRSRGIRNVKA